MSIYQWKKDEAKYFRVADADTEVEFEWFGDNTSFKIEFDFMYGHAVGPHADIMVGYDPAWRNYKGWAIGFENSTLYFKIGNGGGWDVVYSGGQFPNHHWCHVICVLDVENRKISIDVSYMAGNSNVYPVGDDGYFEEEMTRDTYAQPEGNKLVFSPRKYQIAPSQYQRNAYQGSLKNVLLSPLHEDEQVDWTVFTDVPLNVTEMSVANLMNLFEQYSQDRDWIQKAVTRLRAELQEEVALNNNLNDLSSSDVEFLINKIKGFVDKYKDEIVDYEKELTSIYEQLSLLIVENSEIMNKNKMVKDALDDLQAQDLGSKVSNIKAMINTNVNLLQEHKRWGDTGDKYWKFNA